MDLHEKQLIGLQVRTKSGENLGRVYDFIFDSDTGILKKYLVCNSFIAKNILGNELIIDKEMIIEINEKEIVVDDLAIKNRDFYRNLAQA